MSILTTTLRVQEQGNGSKVDYDFSFPCQAATDLLVYKIVRSTGIATLLTLGVDYTVVLSTTTTGGRVTYSVAPTALQDSLIYREVTLTQEADIPSNNIFREEQIENALDKQVTISQQLSEKIGRSIQLPIGSAITNLTLPEPVAGRALVWNDTETGMDNSSVDITIIESAVTASQAAQLAAEAAQLAAETAQGLAEDAKDTAVSAMGTATMEAGLAVTAKTDAETARDLAQNYAAALVGSSASSVLVGTGAKTFTTQASKQWVTGDFMIIVSASAPTNYMWGQVTSYTTTSLVMNILAVGGAGTYADWNVSISGIRGATGATGDVGTTGADGDSINWLGAYAAGTSYVVLDAVSYNGSSYICKLASLGNLPTNTTYWDLMALKGSDGAGSGDVLGPATNTDSNVPQWDGANSKTLKNGLVVGTAANNLVQLTAAAKLPAVDGSLLTNLPSGGASATETSFINASLSTGILTVTHSKALAAGYTAIVTIINNSNKVCIPDDVYDFATNSFKVDLTSYGTLTGTWYCLYITK